MRQERDERGPALAEVFVAAAGGVHRPRPGFEGGDREVGVVVDGVDRKLLPRLGAGVLVEELLALVGEAGVDGVDGGDDAADPALRLLGDGGVVVEKAWEVCVEVRVILGVEAEDRVEMPLDEGPAESGLLEVVERGLEGANGLRVELRIDACEETVGLKLVVEGPVGVVALARLVAARSPAGGALSRSAWNWWCCKERGKQIIAAKEGGNELLRPK